VTQIDFYVLSGDSDDARLQLTCRIADKAMQLDHHVFINCAATQECERLDELLWTFSQGSFVPHSIIGRQDGAQGLEPVLIGCEQEPASERWDLMINLASRVPEYFSRYERVAELVDGNSQRRDLGRDRYRFYRDRGYKINTHQM
jgi:DNA polymerase-3 subunit chi